MDTVTLQNALKQCNETKRYFAGIYAINEIPRVNKKIPSYILVNTDISSGPGEHWLVLFFPNKDKVEIFDSLGQNPHEYNVELVKTLSLNSRISIEYTNKRLQSLQSNVCGAHTLFYCYKKCQKKLGLANLINRHYSNNFDYNDCMVLRFAKKYFKINSSILRIMVATVPNCRLEDCSANKKKNQNGC